MEPKLQALLDKIYQEGVAKGQEVASAVVQDAERKAEKILQEAEKEAVAIRSQAGKDAEELKRNVTSELQLAASQSISALKQQISHLVTFKAVAEPVRDVFSDQEFIRNTIETLIRNWQDGQKGPGDLTLLLPPDEEEALHRYFSAKAKELLDGQLHIEMDGRLTNGFRIGPSDGSYVISFTDKDFEAFFMDYLRPRTKELLYNKD